jgi:hypothetical protein
MIKRQFCDAEELGTIGRHLVLLAHDAAVGQRLSMSELPSTFAFNFCHHRM